MAISGSIGGSRLGWLSGESQDLDPQLSLHKNSMKFQFLLELFENQSVALSNDQLLARCYSPEMLGCAGYGAGEHTIFPCVRTFKSAVRNGVLSETLLGESSSWSCPESPSSESPSLCSTIPMWKRTVSGPVGIRSTPRILGCPTIFLIMRNTRMTDSSVQAEKQATCTTRRISDPTASIRSICLNSTSFLCTRWTTSAPLGTAAILARKRTVSRAREG